MEHTEDRKVMIRISGLKKRYRLGRIGSGTLQGELKGWLERRRSGVKAPAAGKRSIFYALNGVDLTVYKGEKVGIIGRNGAGKSTLLKIVSRITAPTEGTVDLYGRVTSMLEVGTGFHGDMTGRENIYLNGAILGMTRAESDAKMDDIVRFAELEDFIDTPVKRYSSGMFVKLGFSVAFHLDSEIVIMDEVLAVGDMAFQRKCIDSLIKTSRDDERTIFYVSHNMSTIRQLCDRCVVLDKGKVVFNGDVDQAIGIYMGAWELMPTEVVYGPEHRPADRLAGVDDRFTMEQMILADHANSIFHRNETATLDIRCSAREDVKQVGFRFEIWSEDGSKIATSMPRDYTDFSAGVSTARIRLPMSHLTPGRYSADILAFQVKGAGYEFKVDGVYPGFTFQVEPARDEENYVEWNHKYWGAVRLDDNTMELL